MINISMKVPPKMLDVIDVAVDNNHYPSRSEFIRVAIRDKILKEGISSYAECGGNCTARVSEIDYIPCAYYRGHPEDCPFYKKDIGDMDDG